MTERFERLYELPANLYSAGSPVIVSAGALLKDKLTESVLVQLKFQSVSSAPIKALKVGVVAYDVAGKEVDGVKEYQYLDLMVSNGQTFGSNKAIVMPNAVTRSFSIGSITVVQTDGVAKDVTMPITALPMATFLQSGLNDAELVKQYRLAVNNESTYIPQEADGLWMCSCGEWNREDFCTKCRAKKSIVFSAYDIPLLTEKANSRLAQEKAQREEQQRLAEHAKLEEKEQCAKQKAEAEKKQQRNAKIVRTVAIILIPLIIGALVWSLWLWPNILQPAMAYSSAVTLLEEGKYSDAIDAFEALNDYKNSKTNILEAKYRMAFENLSSGNDKEAFELFLEVRPYRNSEEYISDYSFVLTSMEDYLPDYGVYSETYNEKGLLISSTTRSGITYSYEYDEHDRLVAKRGNDETTEYTYDSAGNLLLSKTEDESVEYSYDEDNKLLCKRCKKIDDVLGIKCEEVFWITFYEYDISDRLVRKYDWMDSDYHTLSRSLTEYKYDADGNCISIITYSFDGDIYIRDVDNISYLDSETMLQIQSIATSQTHRTLYTYENGLLVEEKNCIRPGIESVYSYYYENDLLVRKESLYYGVIYTYEYDDFGNLILEEDSDGGSTHYTYTPVFGGDRP